MNNPSYEKELLCGTLDILNGLEKHGKDSSEDGLDLLVETYDLLKARGEENYKKVVCEIRENRNIPKTLYESEEYKNLKFFLYETCYEREAL